ncbi:unnamed protein product [Brachionus calyciflorus]|uniref:Uncharacterized protein n=1 Tax=Brachionus calyciflorus TaxID=104777 RepID=A0A813PXC3_9BILA|nr:unnamed protein product [Brachionus calyciflorus]
MLTKSKFDGYQIGQSVSNNSLKLKSISQENIFDEDDVERYDADTYRQKYGDRWKKFASSVRDVVQPDGTVVREYVIEDPTLLEQLSEEDENRTFKIEKGSLTKDLLSNKMGQKSSANFLNEFKTNQNNVRNNFETKSHYQKNVLSSSSSSSSAPMSSSSSGTSLTNSKNINLFQPINNPIQNLKPQQQNSSNHPKMYNSKYDENSKSYNSRLNVDDVDKEVEIIHEQSNFLSILKKGFEE